MPGKGRVRPADLGEARVPALLAALSVLILGGLAWPFAVDDAFIVARYAERLASGHGYTYNAGPPTDGVTGPLWLLPMVLAHLGGFPALGVAKALGLAAMALAAAWAGFRGGVLAALLVGVESTLWIWGPAGLETGLATLLLAVAVDDAVRSTPHGVPAGLALAGLAWLRPEMALSGGALALVLVVRSPGAAKRALGLAALGVVSVVAFRLSLFSSVLPLSAWAKPPSLEHGLPYVARALLATTGLLGLGPAFVAVRRGGVLERTLAGVIGAQLLGVALGGGDWMPGYRLIAPALPLYAVLLARGFRLWAPRRLVWVPVFAACLAVPVLDGAVALPEVRAAGKLREGPGEALAMEVARHERVALLDVGYVGYRSGVTVIDLGGLTDPGIGRSAGGHLDKRIDAGLLAARDPDAIVVHTSVPPEVSAEGRLLTPPGYAVERHVASLPWVKENFRVARVIPYADHYHYVVLDRLQLK